MTVASIPFAIFFIITTPFVVYAIFDGLRDIVENIATDDL